MFAFAGVAGLAFVFGDGFALAFAGVFAFKAVFAAFALAGAAVFAFAFAGVEAPAGRAPLSSFGLSTTFFARKFSILHHSWRLPDTKRRAIACDYRRAIYLSAAGRPGFRV